MQTLQVSSGSARAEADPPGRWINGPFADFFLLQGGCGLLLLPVALIALMAPQWWSGVFMVWTLGFSLTHQSATYMRLLIDRHCKAKLRHLYVLTPVVLAALFAVLLLAANLLPLVATIWLASQIFHVASQQYGINRRYMRMAGSRPSSVVNRLSTAVILGFPWFALCFTLSTGSNELFWYRLALPPPEMFFGAFKIAAIPALFVLGSYFVIEITEALKRQLVPGRMLSVVATVCVHSLAWFVIRELSWAYVTVSIWHCLQYLTYADKFRTSPPPGVQQDKISAACYAGGIVVFSGLCYALFQVAGYAGGLIVAVLQFTFAFHHYIADALIWRKRTAG